MAGEEPAAIGPAAGHEHAAAQDDGRVRGDVRDLGRDVAVHGEPGAAEDGGDRAGDPGGRSRPVRERDEHSLVAHGHSLLLAGIVGRPDDGREGPWAPNTGGRARGDQGASARADWIGPGGPRNPGPAHPRSAGGPPRVASAPRSTIPVMRAPLVRRSLAGLRAGRPGRRPRGHGRARTGLGDQPNRGAPGRPRASLGAGRAHAGRRWTPSTAIVPGTVESELDADHGHLCRRRPPGGRRPEPARLGDDHGPQRLRRRHRPPPPQHRHGPARPPRAGQRSPWTAAP